MTDQTTTPPADVYPTRTGGDFLLMPREDLVVRGTPEDGPLDEAELTSFGDDGYLTHDEFLTPEEVTELRAELVRLAADPEIRAQESTDIESSSSEVRTIFGVHRSSEVFGKLAHDPRLVGRARQILGSDVYVHQSRVDAKPGFVGGDFFWHSDFETWHAEDGMPRMRAITFSVSLTRTFAHNGPLLVLPGSHTTFVSCGGVTPEENERASLTDQVAGTPGPTVLEDLADRHDIHALTGPAGSAFLFDCNLMQGSNSNITPYPRNHLTFVYNSVENTPVEPFWAPQPRPDHLAARDFTPAG